MQDFATEGPEDDHAEVDVDVHNAVAVADEAFGAGDERVEADAETDFVQHFVGVFGVDPVFDGAGAGQAEAGGRELDDVREGYLIYLLVGVVVLGCLCGGLLLTKTYIFALLLWCEM